MRIPPVHLTDDDDIVESIFLSCGDLLSREAIKAQHLALTIPFGKRNVNVKSFRIKRVQLLLGLNPIIANVVLEAIFYIEVEVGRRASPQLLFARPHSFCAERICC